MGKKGKENRKNLFGVLLFSMYLSSGFVATPRFYSLGLHGPCTLVYSKTTAAV